MSQSAKIRCGYCGREFTTRASGLVRQHGDCPGSGDVPLLDGDTCLAVAHADCLERMSELAPLSVDHIIGDPPYSKSTHATNRRGITSYRERKGDAARAARTRDLGFDPMTDELRLAAAEGFKRIARRWVLVFTDDVGLASWMHALQMAGLEYIRTGVWRKIGSTPQLTGDRPAQSVEFVVIAHQTHPSGKPMKKRWNGRGRHAYWEFPIVLDRGHNGARVHTTQKPVELMSAMIRDFTDPGDLICDPYAGSGSTLVAAGISGRAAYGIEKDAKHVMTAQRRCKGLRQQLSLLDAS